MNAQITHPLALLALGLAATLVSTAAIAQQATPPASAQTMQATQPASTQPRHAALDANADGYIDKAEAANAPHLAQKFDQLDANHDGRLGADERPQHGAGGHAGGGHGRLMQLDGDGDGRISEKEAEADPKLAQRFAQMDIDHDGYLDRSDMQARRQQRRAQCLANAGTNGTADPGGTDATTPKCHRHRAMPGSDRPDAPPPQD